MGLFRDPAKDLERQGIDPVSLQAVLAPTPTPTTVPVYDNKDPEVRALENIAKSEEWEKALPQEAPEPTMAPDPQLLEIMLKLDRKK